MFLREIAISTFFLGFGFWLLDLLIHELLSVPDIWNYIHVFVWSLNEFTDFNGKSATEWMADCLTDFLAADWEHMFLTQPCHFPWRCSGLKLCHLINQKDTVILQSQIRALLSCFSFILLSFLKKKKSPEDVGSTKLYDRLFLLKEMECCFSLVFCDK